MNWKILKHFSTKNQFGFTFADVTTEFPEKNPAYLARILADMVKEGMLYKIYRNHYHVIPLTADPKTYLPGGLQLAKYLMLNKDYYLGYASAMKVHRLTVQRESVADPSEAREYVVTKKQMNPAIRSFRKITVQFIQHDATRFFGFNSMWINQLEQAMVSDLEKTIVDMATRPQFCGGIMEVANALFRAKDRTDHDKLNYYFARNKNKSAKKRFLFLTDLMGLEWTAEHKRMMKELGPGISLLDPSAPDQGRKNSQFGLKMNVDPIGIKEIVLSSV